MPINYSTKKKRMRFIKWLFSFYSAKRRRDPSRTLVNVPQCLAHWLSYHALLFIRFNLMSWNFDSNFPVNFYYRPIELNTSFSCCSVNRTHSTPHKYPHDYLHSTMKFSILFINSIVKSILWLSFLYIHSSHSAIDMIEHVLFSYFYTTDSAYSYNQAQEHLYYALIFNMSNKIRFFWM